MSRIIGLVGMLAPLAALWLLAAHRRRAPMPAAIGLVGAALASLGSAAELVSERTAWIGGEGLEGVLERMEGWALLRLGLTAGGLLLLLVAACVGRGRATPRFPLAVGGAVAGAVGIAARFVPIGGAEHDGIEGFLIAAAVDAVQFGLLGVGTVLVAVAVVSGRDDGPEPLVGVIRIARSAYRELRRQGQSRR